jgi:hypothetical protein
MSQKAAPHPCVTFGPPPLSLCGNRGDALVSGPCSFADLPHMPSDERASERGLTRRFVRPSQ